MISLGIVFTIIILCLIGAFAVWAIQTFFPFGQTPKNLLIAIVWVIIVWRILNLIAPGMI